MNLCVGKQAITRHGCHNLHCSFHLFVQNSTHMKIWRIIFWAKLYKIIIHCTFINRDVYFGLHMTWLWWRWPLKSCLGHISETVRARMLIFSRYIWLTFTLVIQQWNSIYYIPRRKLGDILVLAPSRRRRRRNFLVYALQGKRMKIFFSNLVHTLRLAGGRPLLLGDLKLKIIKEL